MGSNGLLDWCWWVADSRMTATEKSNAALVWIVAPFLVCSADHTKAISPRLNVISDKTFRLNIVVVFLSFILSDDVKNGRQRKGMNAIIAKIVSTFFSLSCYYYVLCQLTSMVFALFPTWWHDQRQKDAKSVKQGSKEIKETKGQSKFASVPYRGKCLQ